MANIRLNILPVSESDFSFKVFRKLKQEDDTKEDNIYFYHLPEDSDLTKRKGYWVSFIPRQVVRFLIMFLDVLPKRKLSSHYTNS